VATEYRRGGRFYFSVFRSLSSNPKVKELFKSVHICRSYSKNKSGPVFWLTVYDNMEFISSSEMQCQKSRSYSYWVSVCWQHTIWPGLKSSFFSAQAKYLSGKDGSVP